MSKRKPFWDTMKNPITMKKEETAWNYDEWKKVKSKNAKIKRKEMRKQVELETGIKTKQNKKDNGKIEILVQNNDCDTKYNELNYDELIYENL